MAIADEIQREWNRRMRGVHALPTGAGPRPAASRPS